MATHTLKHNSIKAQPGKCVEAQSSAEMTLTTSYVASDDFDVKNFPTCSAILDWGQADEDSIEVVVQISQDQGTTWGSVSIVQTPASSAAEAITQPHKLQFVKSAWTPASFTNPAINPIFTNGATHLRFLAKKTTGSSAVTLTFIVFGGPAV